MKDFVSSIKFFQIGTQNAKARNTKIKYKVWIGCPFQEMNEVYFSPFASHSICFVDNRLQIQICHILVMQEARNNKIMRKPEKNI